MPRYTDQQIADALKEARGMLYVAAETLGCSPNTIKDRLEKKPQLRELSNAQLELAIDRAEGKLFDAITSGQPWAIQFFLRTKGKGRGYVERQEVTGSDGAALKVYVGVDLDKV